ncbi:aminotransferase class V-fold PLP-dependent enzyme [Actinopolymorpha alba]|uniref:aminotransferase class V-fold PLP-dependent enzyme n=1 Tax=Actinopolymorpha alba TaxID=533267 RepID=UPI000370ED3E|nr:aminotransferase class V-fold PLP-dependent enzyme [Actinopolymorpha alba]
MDTPDEVTHSSDLWDGNWDEVRDAWDLDPSRAHLNHGSFGAVPRLVRAAETHWRGLADANPMHYYRTLLPPAIVSARAAAADFLGTVQDALALVSNTTAGVSTVLAALALREGEEVLLTDHAYGAVALAVARFAGAAGAQVKAVKVPLTATDEEVVRAVADGITSRTRLVLIDQITSPTARLFPVRRVAEEARARGVTVFVDGAHVPGMLPVDVEALGADFWVGNFHKWAFAGRSVAGLWVAPSWRPQIQPLVVSWNEEQRFPAAFDQQGTRDGAVWLALPDALRFFESLEPERLRQYNNGLAAYGQSVVASALGTSLDGVGGDPRLSMRLVALPRGVADTGEAATALYERISRDLHVEVAVTSWAGRGWLRLSAQAYNAPAEYERFAHGIAGLLR